MQAPWNLAQLGTRLLRTSSSEASVVMTVATRSCPPRAASSPNTSPCRQEMRRLVRPPPAVDAMLVPHRCDVDLHVTRAFGPPSTARAPEQTRVWWLDAAQAPLSLYRPGSTPRDSRMEMSSHLRPTLHWQPQHLGAAARVNVGAAPG